ncbi:MAG: hypothetical protein ABJJ25_15735 [Eudoraea sp.]|uniref:hypothetical protein n=1 Tax=Eudoraea sp. TaxID=1979955 RepID=UPI003267A8DE
MKRIFFLLILVFSVYIGYSQVLIAAVFGDKLNSVVVEFGIEKGYNWSDISELDNSKIFTSFRKLEIFTLRNKTRSATMRYIF